MKIEILSIASGKMGFLIRLWPCTVGFPISTLFRGLGNSTKITLMTMNGRD
jgi:hypothetical protein